MYNLYNYSSWPTEEKIDIEKDYNKILDWILHFSKNHVQNLDIENHINAKWLEYKSVPTDDNIWLRKLFDGNLKTISYPSKPDVKNSDLSIKTIGNLEVAIQDIRHYDGPNFIGYGRKDFTIRNAPLIFYNMVCEMTISIESGDISFWYSNFFHNKRGYLRHSIWMNNMHYMTEFDICIQPIMEYHNDLQLNLLLLFQ